MAVLSELSKPWHGAEHRNAKRGKGAMSEHRDVRVRAGALGARSAGKSNEHDVRSITVPA
jgi:hypothetical protein